MLGPSHPVQSIVIPKPNKNFFPLKIMSPPVVPTKDRPSPKKCYNTDCSCPGCPSRLHLLKNLYYKLYTKVTDPHFKTLVSCDFTLKKKEIQYLFDLIASDQYENFSS